MIELIAVAALSGYGWYASTKAPTQPRKPYGDAPDLPPSALVKDYEDRARQRSRAAQVPAISGIITPNTKLETVMPFYRSAKTQNWNPGVNQRKFETYSGQTAQNGEWKPKQEVEAIFPAKPQGYVTSSGTLMQNVGAQQDASRIPKFTRHNNVLPFQQIRVGPGLGVGPDVIATGGRHQFYRQLPVNINAHKLTELPGNINIGGSTIPKPPAPANVTINRNPGGTLMKLEDRPPLPAGGHVRGRAIQPVETYKPDTKRVHEQGWVAPASGTTATYVAPVGGPRDTARGAPVNNPAINPTLARVGVGAYTITDAETQRIGQQRETEADWIGYGSLHRGPAAPAGFNQRPTNREDEQRMANPRPLFTLGTTREAVPPPTTLKETLIGARNLGPARGRTAQAMDTVKKPAVLRASKRGRQVGRMLMSNPGRDFGVVKTWKSRVRTADTHDTLTRANPKGWQRERAELGGRERPDKRREPVNTRLGLDLGLAQMLNRDNPLAIDLGHTIATPVALSSLQT